MSIGPLRLLLAVAMTALLLRGARVAWSQRSLALAIWRSLRPRHLAGALAILVLLMVVASALLAVPPLRLGLGSLLGFGGNAVFVPLEEAAARAGPGPANGPDWTVAGMATVFLLFLGTLLPWFAFVEEEIFRAGLEVADLRAEVMAALVFGLVHLIMLIPVAAALAVAVAGFCYGRVYRRRYARVSEEGAVRAPTPVLRAYRPTRRARAAAWRLARADVGLDASTDVEPRSPLDEVEVPSWLLARRLRAQAAAVHESAVWHTAFNSLVLLLVWLAIVVDSVLLRL